MPFIDFQVQVPVTTWVLGFSIRSDVAQRFLYVLPPVATTIFPVITLVKVAGVTVTVNVTRSPIDGERSETEIVVVVLDATADAAGVPIWTIPTLAIRVRTKDQDWKRLFMNSPYT